MWVGRGWVPSGVSYLSQEVPLVYSSRQSKGNKVNSLHYTQFISLCPYRCKPVKMKKCLRVIRLITTLKYLQWFPSTLTISLNPYCGFNPLSFIGLCLPSAFSFCSLCFSNTIILFQFYSYHQVFLLDISCASLPSSLLADHIVSLCLYLSLNATFPKRPFSSSCLNHSSFSHDSAQSICNNLLINFYVSPAL